MRLSVYASWFLSERGYQTLRQVIGILLLLGCSAQLAALTWQFIAGMPDSNLSPLPSTQTSDSNTRQTLLTALNQAALFGRANDTNGSHFAPKSNLNAHITGILASSDPAMSLAIILHEGSQNTYNIGDVITGTRAKIKAIYPNRVIISRDGHEEALLLDEDGNTAVNNTLPAQKPNEFKPLTTVRQEILKRPQQLLDYIRITPVMSEDEELEGYKINPGRNADAFEQLGLRPDDIAININGYNLKDKTQAIQAVHELSRKTEFNITVMRDGAPHELYINLTQP